jgi:hypothetical protein
MERRAFATGKVHMPGTDIIPSSVPLSLDDYLATKENPENTISTMIGDLERIDKYPALGFQIYQEIPPAVRAAHESLVAHGYN